MAICCKCTSQGLLLWTCHFGVNDITEQQGATKCQADNRSMHDVPPGDSVPGEREYLMPCSAIAKQYTFSNDKNKFDNQLSQSCMTCSIVDRTHRGSSPGVGIQRQMEAEMTLDTKSLDESVTRPRGDQSSVTGREDNRGGWHNEDGSHQGAGLGYDNQRMDSSTTEHHQLMPFAAIKMNEGRGWGLPAQDLWAPNGVQIRITMTYCHLQALTAILRLVRTLDNGQGTFHVRRMLPDEDEENAVTCTTDEQSHLRQHHIDNAVAFVFRELSKGGVSRNGWPTETTTGGQRRHNQANNWHLMQQKWAWPWHDSTMGLEICASC